MAGGWAASDTPLASSSLTPGSHGNNSSEPSGRPARSPSVGVALGQRGRGPRSPRPRPRPTSAAAALAQRGQQLGLRGVTWGQHQQDFAVMCKVSTRKGRKRRPPHPKWERGKSGGASSGLAAAMGMELACPPREARAGSGALEAASSVLSCTPSVPGHGAPAWLRTPPLVPD